MRLKKATVILVAVFFMSALCLVAIMHQFIHQPLLSQEASPIILTLDKSTTASRFATELKNKKLIVSRQLLLLYIRYMHFSSKLKAGVYQLNPNETVQDLLYKIVAGDVLHFNFVIIEGSTQKKVESNLVQAPYLQVPSSLWDDFKQDHASAEGLFLADTYQYTAGSSAKLLLAQAHHRLIDYLNESWASRWPGLPYKTPYELLIAASIIEKESAVSHERYLISGVLMNRLKKNMPLQMDPTVIYALGDMYKGGLVHDDLSVNSPYNTYLNKGLPPTPIAMVGKEAINAAAHPLLSNYLYFMAKGDGTHRFSQTYEEQKKAINQYRKTKGL